MSEANLSSAEQPFTPEPGGSARDDLAEVGAELRRAREARGLSREALAERLRLGPEQLQALEEGDRAHLPERVFVVAQLRRVAGALEVDLGDRLSRSRAGMLGAAAGATSGPQRPAARSASHRPAAAEPRRLQAVPPARALMLMALVLLLAVAAVLFVRRPLSERPIRNRPAPDRAGMPSQAAGTNGSSAGPAAGGAGGAGPAAILVLQARSPSWLEVRHTDGTVLYRGLFQGRRQFPLQRPLQVLAGRPDLVQVSAAGRPAAALGAIDRVQWVPFSASGTP